MTEQGERLFDVGLREPGRPVYYAEPDYRYLNQSPRPAAVEVRRELSLWYSRYPETDRAGLANRFRSDRGRDHRGAALELFLHEVLTRLECKLTLEPSVAGFRHRPDFEVEPPAGGSFFLEATSVSGLTADEESQQEHANRIYDIIGSRIRSPDFWISIATSGNLKAAPARSLVVEPIQSWLDGLRWEGFDGDDHRASMILPLDGLALHLHAIAKPTNVRGRSDVRPIGAIASQGKWGH